MTTLERLSLHFLISKEVIYIEGGEAIRKVDCFCTLRWKKQVAFLGASIVHEGRL